MKPFKTKQGIEVPCGQCYDCKNRRVSAWAFRLEQEAKISKTALFVTLTYDTDHVPLSKNGFMTLNKKDVQDFLKRLRKKTANKIKYYCAGEYGTNKKRPHYHLILFNSFEQDIQESWIKTTKIIKKKKQKSLIISDYTCKNTKKNTPSVVSGVATRERVERSDPRAEQRTAIGEIHVTQINNARIKYTLKYICKNKSVGLFPRDDRKPEFSLMSKGIGKNYINEKTKKWHLDDLENRYYCPDKDGYKTALPRYYKEKLYTKEERENVGKGLINKEMEEFQKKTYEQVAEETKNNAEICKYKETVKNKDTRSKSNNL